VCGSGGIWRGSAGSLQRPCARCCGGLWLGRHALPPEAPSRRFHAFRPPAGRPAGRSASARTPCPRRCHGPMSTGIACSAGPTRTTDLPSTAGPCSRREPASPGAPGRRAAAAQTPLRTEALCRVHRRARTGPVPGRRPGRAGHAGREIPGSKSAPPRFDEAASATRVGCPAGGAGGPS
jgi:hypothetical protein